ncbi:MAG: outer membrane protein assembly factor BamE [Candidatus Brocadiaceae bacterium]|nr:outer membrane protein assembly factor BamE [Candidatus Brocadiaceae bacterium]
MRPPVALSALAALVAVAWGCTTSPPRGRPAGIEPGMTARQVEEALGTPLKTERPGVGAEVWYYEDDVVVLDRGRVTYRFPVPSPSP